MITILAMIVCGGVLVVGVICIIIGHSSTNSNQKQAKQSFGKETMAMVKFSEKNPDLVILPDGTKKVMPKEFDPYFVMKQLAQIQNSPNLVSAYVDCLVAKFRAGREIAYINKVQEYSVALAGGMEAQLGLRNLQAAFDDLDDPRKILLRDAISLEELQRDLAKVRAETEKYRNIGTQQLNHKKNNDPREKSYNQTKGKIGFVSGRLDAIEEKKQERDAKIQNVLRGRKEEEVSSYAKEEIMKIRKYYGAILDDL